LCSRHSFIADVKSLQSPYPPVHPRNFAGDRPQPTQPSYGQSQYPNPDTHAHSSMSCPPPSASYASLPSHYGSRRGSSRPQPYLTSFSVYSLRVVHLPSIMLTYFICRASITTVPAHCQDRQATSSPHIITVETNAGDHVS
jgi:hypothetical protein